MCDGVALEAEGMAGASATVLWSGNVQVEQESRVAKQPSRCVRHGTAVYCVTVKPYRVDFITCRPKIKKNCPLACNPKHA